MEPVKEQYERLRRIYDEPALQELEEVNRVVKEDSCNLFNKFRDASEPAIFTMYLISALEETAKWYVNSARISELNCDEKWSTSALNIAQSLEDAAHRLNGINLLELKLLLNKSLK